jgi:hypothetical protein
MTAVYAYCIVKSDAAPKLKKAPPGLVGMSKPRVLDAAGYSLIVADAPLKLYDAAAIDARLRDLDWVSARAGEHDAVVEHMIDYGTVVPMKLFTLFSSEASAIEHVKKAKKSLDRVTDRIGGCEEWSLRILLDEERARAAAKPKKKATSGTGFLQAKKKLEDARKTATEAGSARAGELFEALAKIAKQSERRPAPNRDLAQRVFLDAVFLVPQPKVKKLQTAIDRAAGPLVEQGFDITLSGPWPAYSFIG